MSDIVEWVMGSSATLWTWWEDVERFGDDKDSPDSVKLTIEDPLGADFVDEEWPSIVKTVSASDIVAAFHTAVACHGVDADHENLDASSADIVLQLAVLGEVVYG